MKKTNKLSPEKWFCIGIPVTFLLGSLLHFVYDWSSQMAIVGIFAPVNESIWEHLKLAFFPLLLWNTLGYLKFKNDYNFKNRSYLIGSGVSAIVAPLIIVTFYYTYTGAFGIHSIVLDIFSLLLAIALSQTLAIHIYKYGSFSISALFITYALVFIFIALFITFTFNPPHLPMFLDGQTGTYGA
ncbi:MAG: DUF6512 family protein [Clostridium sp.]